MLSIGDISRIVSDKGLKSLKNQNLFYWEDSDSGITIIYDSKNGSNLSHNGLIMSSRGEVIACPAPSCGVARQEMAPFLGKPIYDGTSCVLYYNQLNDKWQASTRRSLHMTETPHGMSCTLMQGLIEAAGGDVEFDRQCAQLNRSLCYTIGYHCKSHHFTSLDNFIWSIYTCDKEGVEATDVSLPSQWINDTAIPFESVSQAERWAEETRGFGVLLQSEANNTQRTVIQTDKMIHARVSFYSNSLNNEIKAHGYDKMTYILTKYLQKPDNLRKDFVKKYPHFEKICDEAVKCFNKCITSIKFNNPDPYESNLNEAIRETISSSTIKRYTHIIDNFLRSKAKFDILYRYVQALNFEYN